MRIAVLSDVHANHLALRAVLEDAQRQSVEACWFLGDLMGYGPAPIEVLKWFSGRWDVGLKPRLWLMGNHDAMLADLILRGKSGATPTLLADALNYPLPDDLVLPVDDPESIPENTVEFLIEDRKANGERSGEVIYRGEGRGVFLRSRHWGDLGGATPLLALELNRLTLAQSPEMDAAWRRMFTKERAHPVDASIEDMDFVLVHGSLEAPLFRYLYAWQREILLPAEFKQLRQRGQNARLRVQFCGHTHVPMLVRARPVSGDDSDNLEIKPVFVLPGETYSLDRDVDGRFSMVLINPGSVGQPRDLDRRAAYVVLDTEAQSITFRRVAYDYREIVYLLRQGGYPRSLRRRLITARPTGSTPPIWMKHYERAREVAV